jgi:hypothetical protein
MFEPLKDYVLLLPVLYSCHAMDVLRSIETSIKCPTQYLSQTVFALEQWFSTFLSLWHTNFKRKFGDTLKGKKDPKDENMTVFAYFLQYFKI